MTSLDVTGATDDELWEWLNQVSAEQDRRRTLLRAADQSDALARRYLAASGVHDGDPWVQPHGAYDAYPIAWTVTYNGKTWINLVSGNVWEPGVSSWREDTGGGTPPAWVRPSGATDAYNTGDLVIYQGVIYKSLIDANVWAPDGYPAGWEAQDGTT